MRKEAVAAILILAGLAGLAIAEFPFENPGEGTINEDGPFDNSEPELQSFSSSSEMKSYFERASSGGGSLASFSASRDTLESQNQALTADSGSGGGQKSVERYSKTNNQERNVQEPDILKTDGTNFYYSPEQNNYRIMRTSVVRPRVEKSNISVFSGLKSNFSETGSIGKNGEMLLSENILTVQTRQGLEAYDVSEPEDPDKEWQMGLNGSIVASRQIDDSILIVLRENVDYQRPCPIPLASGSDSLTIACDDIGYFPSDSPEADSTYTALKVSEEGKLEDSTSIVGSTSNTVVYASEKSIYITNQDSMTESEIMTGFLQEEGDSLFSDSEMNRIDEIIGYNISEQSKMIELQSVFESHTKGMDEDERDKWEKRFENELGNYTADNRREFTSTDITEIGIEEMSVEETGRVPGRVNDQFSLDERDDRLRIATTVGADSWGVPENSANDMYVLDPELDITGSVKNMGLNERIYSARFIDDKAYIVTFRRIDPFHVIDLSDPENPELKGELKLPGFSSYLHQLDEDRILGVGEENGKVKAVIFNVENDNPTIADSNVLNDYNSEINQNHHAFMLDKKHEVFFLPGDNGGYIYSYSDGLERKMEIDIENPNRARYVNDHLYVFGDYSVSVIDEENWEVTKKLEFRDKPERDDDPIYFGRPTR